MQAVPLGAHSESWISSALPAQLLETEENSKIHSHNADFQLPSLSPLRISCFKNQITNCFNDCTFISVNKALCIYIFYLAPWKKRYLEEAARDWVFLLKLLGVDLFIFSYLHCATMFHKEMLFWVHSNIIGAITEWILIIFFFHGRRQGALLFDGFPIFKNTLFVQG